MLLVVFILAFVIGLIGAYVSDEKPSVNYIGFPSVIFAAIAFLALLVSGITIVCNQVSKSSEIAAMQVKYDSLVYQYENGIYDDGNGVSKRELIVDIEKWNMDIARNKKDQHDFWIGVFIPDIYDQFEFIELDGGV